MYPSARPCWPGLDEMMAEINIIQLISIHQSESMGLFKLINDF